jgi:4-hydroxy-tetrahydrodipicolinate synthase
MKTLEGIITALVTPLSNDGSLDLPALQDLVRRQLAAGAAGLCPLGGTGEPLSMSLTEHKQVIDIVVDEVAGRVPVIVGTLLGAQDDIIECGRHARTAGADAIMVIPPYFIVAKPAHIRRHFADIAERVDLPMVLFHGPSRSGIRLDAETIVQLLHDVPRFVGIKETSGDLTIAAELLRAGAPGLRILQGFDEYVLPSLALGAHGAVLSLGCLIPNLLRALAEHCDAGRLDAARPIQLDLLPLCKLIYGEPNPGPLKHAMRAAGLPGGFTRKPIYAPSTQTEQGLARLLPSVLRAEEAARG